MIYFLFKISIIAFIFIQLIEPEMIFSFYGKMIDGLPEWLYKPLGGCLYCFTGQVCFWGYLFYPCEYNIIDHLFFASLGIFLASIYDQIWNLEN